MSIDAPLTQQGDEVRTSIFKSMISQRVENLKSISHQAHTLYNYLQILEQFCNKALSWISPIFNIWGPYIQFLERLIILMAN